MTNYTDLWLKFPDEETATTLLFDVEDDNYPYFLNTDVVGTIYHADTDTTTVGWHVNVRLTPEEDGTPLMEYSIPEPLEPKHVWASRPGA